jgi:hypothetical protein
MRPNRCAATPKDTEAVTHPFRSILALSIVAIVAAACGTTIGAPASEPPAPSQPATPVVEPSEEPTAEPAAPSEPAEPADEERDVDGILTVYPGTWSGPGGMSTQDALDAGPTGPDMPNVVNGVLFRDTDGRIYLATSVSDVAAPTFDGPMLEVLDHPNDGDMWDMANAEMLGLEEANGIVFRQGTDILGTLELP